MRTDLKKNRNDTERSSGTKLTVADQFLLDAVPPPPEKLNDTGIMWWNYYCGLMIESGYLSRYFIASLGNLCFLLQIIEPIENKLLEDGTFIDIVKTYKGEEYTEEVLNPLSDKIMSYYEKFDKLAGSLGFTPYASKVLETDATGAKSGVASVTTPPPADVGSPPETIPFVAQSG